MNIFFIENDLTPKRFGSFEDWAKSFNSLILKRVESISISDFNELKKQTGLYDSVLLVNKGVSINITTLKKIYSSILS
jgi:hypothetical protein